LLPRLVSTIKQLLERATTILVGVSTAKSSLSILMIQECSTPAGGSTSKKKLIMNQHEDQYNYPGKYRDPRAEIMWVLFPLVFVLFACVWLFKKYRYYTVPWRFDAFRGAMWKDAWRKMVLDKDVCDILGETKGRGSMLLMWLGEDANAYDFHFFDEEGTYVYRCVGRVFGRKDFGWMFAEFRLTKDDFLLSNLCVDFPHLGKLVWVVRDNKPNLDTLLRQNQHRYPAIIWLRKRGALARYATEGYKAYKEAMLLEHIPVAPAPLPTNLQIR